MNVAIVGSRTFADFSLFGAHLATWCKEHGSPLRVVSGGAVGVDKMAERWAAEHDIPITVILPDYGSGKVNPRAAPLIRNTAIVAACDCVVAFSRGGSRGTADTIKKARASGKPVYVYEV